MPRADEPGEPDLPRRLHDDDRVVLPHPLLPGLDEQLDLDHHDGVVGAGRDPAVHLRHDRRVGDRLEGAPAVVVGEREVGECGPVQRAVGVEDPGPESVGERRQRRLPGLDHPARDRVGIHHVAPRCPKRSATVDLPEPIPPVRATSSTTKS